MSLNHFHPAVADWFGRRFDAPTPAQAAAWPAIRSGRHTLVAAPTGSGKTLTAFLDALDRLVVQGLADGGLPDATQVIYVSPLKALSNDIRLNLEEPLAGIRAALRERGLADVEIRTAVRTGDTPQVERTRMWKRPPHVLVTTPESLYVLMGSDSGRRMLSSAREVIVDEIHAIAASKRGSHLSLTLERLDALCGKPLTRIGLSATQRPIEAVARFLTGARNPDCHVVDLGHARRRDLAIEMPAMPLQAVMSAEAWDGVYARLAELVNHHRTTLVFVNTRRMAERAARHLGEKLGRDAVAAHHGSLSKEHRLAAERRLKHGELRVLVATASLELGIDIGDVDLVCQLGSPRSVSALLQRVGRSGHFVGGTPKGRLFPSSRDDLVECVALLDAIRRGELDLLRIPQSPIDVLAQQIVAETASQDWDEDALYALVTGAAPYAALPRERFDAVVRMLAEGFTTRRGPRAAYLHRDAVHRRLRGRRGSRTTAVTSGGTIPDMADYAVVLEPQALTIGSVNEDFAVESLAGDVFQLGNTSYRILRVERDKVRVEDAQGAPPSIPFWLGEAPGRSDVLSFAVSRLREEVEQRLDLAGERARGRGRQERGSAGLAGPSPPAPLPEGEGRGPASLSGGQGSLQTTECTHNRSDVLRSEHPSKHASDQARRARAGGVVRGARAQEVRAQAYMDVLAAAPDGAAGPSPTTLPNAKALDWLHSTVGIDHEAARQLVAYIADSVAALGTIPTQHTLVMERFFDQSGGTQLVIHSPYGSRLNRAWGLALRKRFCRQFNFELQAAATEDAIVLSLSTSHSFPLEDVGRYLHSASAAHVLTQALLDAPLFGVRWRWNAATALALPRFVAGHKVAPQLQRMKSEDLLATVFPDQVACAENLAGEREIPDHPLVQQTLDDCLNEAMDLDGLLALLRRIESGHVRIVARDLPAPSPLAAEVLGARPYAFLDDAPLEERRTQAVQDSRFGNGATVAQFGRLDPDAIAAVREEAWPDARDADEMHEVLCTLGFATAAEVAANAHWLPLLAELAASGRATRLHTDGDTLAWSATERLPQVQASRGRPLETDPVPVVPAEFLRETWTAGDALRELLRARLAALGPVTADRVARECGVDVADIDAALLALQSEGYVMQGHFSGDDGTLEWCERHLLARIHRYTIGRLRREVEPVAPRDFVRFLLHWQHLVPESRVQGPEALPAVLAQLEGWEAPAGAWEGELLRARIADYSLGWLDDLCLSGRLAWTRLGESGGERGTGALRTTPIVLLPRARLAAWTALAGQGGAQEALSSRARRVQDVLEAHGASFFDEMLGGARLLPAELEDALSELVARGLVSADGFSGLRALLVPSAKRPAAGGRQRRRALFGIADAGRWALTRRGPAQAGAVVDAEVQAAAVEQVARSLLTRYGVVGWRLLQREASWLPRWRDLLRAWQRLEARGEIRGGRFIAGLAGEQFALPEAVGLLRRIRKQSTDGQLVLVSGADPLNLVGTLLPGTRVPRVAAARVLYRDGVPIATRIAGTVVLHEAMSPAEETAARSAILRGVPDECAEPAHAPSGAVSTDSAAARR